jgi:hypothetical protein
MCAGTHPACCLCGEYKCLYVKWPCPPPSIYLLISKLEIFLCLVVLGLLRSGLQDIAMVGSMEGHTMWRAWEEYREGCLQVEGRTHNGGDSGVVVL